MRVKDKKARIKEEELNKNEELIFEIKSTFGNSIDFKMVEGMVYQKKAVAFYLESMVDTQTLNESTQRLFSTEPGWKVDLLTICKEIFWGMSCKETTSKKDMVQEIINGSLVIIVDGFNAGISIMMPNNEGRSVTEPTAQTVIRGPKDGFVESISTNISLIRRRIRNPNLCFEEFIVGMDTQTKVYIGFIQGITNKKIVQEVRNRIKRINVSAIFESGDIEQLIVDKSFTFFPLALDTERPDSVAANLIEGKVAILIDGTPFALIVPAVFVNFFEAAEDYYLPFGLGSFLRLIRYLSFLIALITPSIYISVLTFHQELLPTPLLISVIAQRQGVPFPAVVEVLLMEITFEILREAGVRMPRTVGQMVSIVGALVIGQAAAEAGIISNIMIIVVAITAIANFVSPIYSFASASRLIRFILIIFSSFLGFYGVLVVLIAMVAHLSSLRSFGVPYLAPIAPFMIEDQKDVFIRLPNWAMKRRPKYLQTQSEKKVFKESNPSPPMMEKGDRP